MARWVDRVGMRYGRLTVESLNRKEKRQKGEGAIYYWNCKCDCGKSIVASGKSLSCHQRESCGCLHGERISQSKKGVNRKYGLIPKFNTEKDALAYLYSITPAGEIFSKCDGRKMTISKGPRGYQIIRLKNPQFSRNKDGRKTYKVHRLVAMFYLPNYSESLQVNHKDGDKGDNKVENLEMVTNHQNVLHAWKFLDEEGKRRRLLAERNNVVFRDRRVVVEQLKDGKVIAMYPTISCAAMAVNGFRSSLWNCLDKSNRTYKGFHWRRVCAE